MPAVAAPSEPRVVRSHALALIGPTRRAMEWLPAALAAALALGVAVEALVASSDGQPLPASSLRMALVLLAAGAAFALDDPAEVTVASAPTPRWWRRALRLGLATSVWAGCVLAVGAVLGAAPGPLPVADLTVEAAGWLALGFAAAALAGGTAAVPALVIALVALRWLPERLAMDPAWGFDDWTAVRNRWLAVIACAALVVVASGLDPARRRPRRR